MEGLVYLSGEHRELSIGELKGALKALQAPMDIRMEQWPLILTDKKVPPELAGRLGYCHFAGSVESKCKTGIESILDSIDVILGDVSRDTAISFKVKSTGDSGLTPGSLFGKLESKLMEGPYKLRHREPERKFFVVMDGSTSYLGWIDSETDRRELLSRRASRMPYRRPVGMDPRMARAMTNLLGATSENVLLDPFMGPGGLLIEAGLMGYRCTGIELDPDILRGAWDNIEHLGIKDRISTHLGDSRRIIPEMAGSEDFDCILTDPPFGKGSSTNGADPISLITEVLEKGYQRLSRGAPVVLDTNDPAIFRKLEGYEMVENYAVRVHRSMVRYILLMKRK